MALNMFFRLFFPHPKRAGSYVMKDFPHGNAARAWVSVTLPGVNPDHFLEAYGFIVED